ncbi:hypothetical protein [Burkholderia ambifaria]|nr:hypothetical protein [Burkholderia ambifaria]
MRRIEREPAAHGLDARRGVELFGPLTSNGVGMLAAAALLKEVGN